MTYKDTHQELKPPNAQFAGVHMMMSNKNTRSNLTVIKDLCDDLEENFECFTLDRHWNEDRDRLTVCFTAEQVKESPTLYTKRGLR